MFFEGFTFLTSSHQDHVESHSNGRKFHLDSRLLLISTRKSESGRCASVLCNYL